ncbi:MAG: PAS domain-containing protein [Candidatus Thermoplasmatota archaeon]|nr:PAS domain-containing protein [Candidatus Thermoplasmatota archaeon]
MTRKMERPIFIRDKNPLAQGSSLVVGIDKKGKIIRFNDTLEQFTGSVKKDVLDVPFASYFSKQIPKKELEKLVKQARYNPDSLDIDTSFRTVQGDDVVVSWTGFAIKNDEDGRVSQLNLVGTPQKQITSSAQSKKTSKKKNSTPKSKTKKQKKSEKKSTTKPEESKQILSASQSKKQDSKNEELSKPNPKKTENKKKKSKLKKQNKENKTSSKTKSFNTNSSKKKRKKINIKRKSKSKKTKEPNTEKLEEKINDQKKKKLFSKRISFKKRKPKSSPKNEKQTNLLSKTLKISKPSLFSKIKTPSFNIKPKKKQGQIKHKHKSEKKSVKQLKKELSKLTKQNRKLENKLQEIQLNKQKIKDFFNTNLRFFRDSIGIKKKREEFRLMMKQLSDRKQKLEQLETDMVLEKKEFKQKIEEFILWREKLEKLEQEIEKRRKFLSEQETFLNSQYDKVLSHELSQPASYTQELKQEAEIDEESKDDSGLIEKEDLFNSLTVEAAVLQRGRIKKINDLFAKMLGFSEDDLIGKHLVDFVTPLGLEGVEHHYMNRLKGVDDLSYQTVFMSKTKDEIPVKVNIKNTDFHGERAEIVTFNEL